MTPWCSPQLLTVCVLACPCRYPDRARRELVTLLCFLSLDRELRCQPLPDVWHLLHCLLEGIAAWKEQVRAEPRAPGAPCRPGATPSPPLCVPAAARALPVALPALPAPPQPARRRAAAAGHHRQAEVRRLLGAAALPCCPAPRGRELRRLGGSKAARSGCWWRGATGARRAPQSCW